MSKEATEFFRKERLALEQEAKRVKEQNKALEKQVEGLSSKVIRVRDYATHRKEYSSNMRAILELLKEKE